MRARATIRRNSLMGSSLHTQITTEGSGIALLLEDKLNLGESTGVLSHRYSNATPFPHLVLDHLFPDELMEAVAREMPAVDNEEYWIAKFTNEEVKYNFRSAVNLGPAATALSALMHSAPFLYFLSEVTGIWGLLPDPYLQGAAYHVSPRGGKFDVHIDRKTDYGTGLQRRLALITYLNHDWMPEYGGSLELWNADASKCEVKVEPAFNRTILFDVGENNYHGFPTPIACPKGQMRKSFAAYFHTAGKADAKIDVRSSVFAPNFYRKQNPVSALIRELTPPLVVRWIRAIRWGS